MRFPARPAPAGLVFSNVATRLPLMRARRPRHSPCCHGAGFPASGQSGFTLVEIAITLLIVGLLLGGMLKGQELIDGTKAKNLTADFARVPALLHAYQDKYRRLPGDDPAADRHVGAQAGTNGNGDGQIGGHWDDAPSGGTCASEACHFWLHVRLANLSGGTTAMDAADYPPVNAEGAPIGIASTAPVAGWSGNFFVCSAGIRGRHARQIDIGIDDGATHTGSIRAIGGSPPAFQALTAGDDTTRYTVCAAF